MEGHVREGHAVDYGYVVPTDSNDLSNGHHFVHHHNFGVHHPHHDHDHYHDRYHDYHDYDYVDEVYYDYDYDFYFYHHRVHN
jgi:hypothetical protein